MAGIWDYGSNVVDFADLMRDGVDFYNQFSSRYGQGSASAGEGFDPSKYLGMADDVVAYNLATARLFADLNFRNEMTAAQEANRFSAEQAEINRRFQAQQIDQANRFSAEQAQINRDFINSQRSTSYQTAVQDLRQAGLNPALLYANGGAGAPTVSGAVSSGAYASGSSASGFKASSQMAQIDLSSFKDILSAVISSATSLKNTNTMAGAQITSAMLGFAGNILSSALR